MIIHKEKEQIFLQKKVPLLCDSKSLCQFLKSQSISRTKLTHSHTNCSGLLLAIEKWNSIHDKEKSQKFEILLPQICKWANRRCRRWKYDFRFSISIALESKYIRHLLANVFLLNVNVSLFPSLDLRLLYSLPIAIEQILCWINYFYKEYKYKTTIKTATTNRRTIILEKCNRDEKDIKFQEESSETLGKAISYLTLSLDRMEDITCHYCSTLVLFYKENKMMTPYASKEEILFLCHPELYIARFFLEDISLSVKEKFDASNDAVDYNQGRVFLFRNVQRYSSYRGYKETFAFLDEDIKGEIPLFHFLLVIPDPLNLQRAGIAKFLDLFQVAFLASPSKKIATSLCVLQNEEDDDSPYVSFLWQLCVAQVTNIHLIYSTFGDKKLAREYQQMASLLYDTKIKQVMTFLQERKEDNKKLAFPNWLKERTLMYSGIFSR